MAIARRIRPAALLRCEKTRQLASLGQGSTDYHPHARVSYVLLGKAE
jgi:hypothetical protein